MTTKEGIYSATDRTGTTRNHSLYRSRQAPARKISLSAVRGRARGGTGMERQNERGLQYRAAFSSDRAGVIPPQCFPAYSPQ